MFGSLLAALLPAVVDIGKDAIKAGTEKWIGLSVDDKIKLAKAEVERVQAVAALDNPGGTPHQWVVDLRASFRYIAAALSIIGGLGIIYTGLEVTDAVQQYAVLTIGADLIGIPFAFIFGERMYLGIKAFVKK